MTRRPTHTDNGRNAERSAGPPHRPVDMTTNRDFAAQPDTPPAYTASGRSKGFGFGPGALGKWRERLGISDGREKIPALFDQVNNIQLLESQLVRHPEGTLDIHPDDIDYNFVRLGQHLALVESYERLAKERLACKAKFHELPIQDQQSIFRIDSMIQKKDLVNNELHEVLRSSILSLSERVKLMVQQEETLRDFPPGFRKICERDALVKDYHRLNVVTTHIQDLRVIDRLPENDPSREIFHQVQAKGKDITRVSDTFQQELQEYKQQLIADWHPIQMQMHDEIVRLEKELQKDAASIQFSQLAQCMEKFDQLAVSFHPPEEEIAEIVPQHRLEVFSDGSSLDDQLAGIYQSSVSLVRRRQAMQVSLFEKLNPLFLQFPEKVTQMKTDLTRLNAEIAMVQEHIAGKSDFKPKKQSERPFYKIKAEYDHLKENTDFFMNGGFDSINMLKIDYWESQYPDAISSLRRGHDVSTEIRSTVDGLFQAFRDIPERYGVKGLNEINADLSGVCYQCFQLPHFAVSHDKYFELYQSYQKVYQEAKSFLPPLQWILHHCGDERFYRHGAEKYDHLNRQFEFRFSERVDEMHRWLSDRLPAMQEDEVPEAGAFKLVCLYAKSCELIIATAADAHYWFLDRFVQGVTSDAQKYTGWLNKHAAAVLGSFQDVRTPSDLMSELESLNDTYGSHPAVSEEHSEWKQRYKSFCREFSQLENAHIVCTLIPSDCSDERVQDFRQRLGDDVGKALDTLFQKAKALERRF